MKLEKMLKIGKFGMVGRADKDNEYYDRAYKLILGIEREERNDPEWMPRYLLNGAWAFSLRVQEQIEEYEQLEHDRLEEEYVKVYDMRYGEELDQED